MNYDYLDIADELERVDALRAEIKAEMPIERDRLGRAMQRLRLEWTYHSNAIEGNSLTYGETRALLLRDRPARGKPFKDHQNIKRHLDALDFLEGFVASDAPVTVDLLKDIHRQLMGDTGSLGF